MESKDKEAGLPMSKSDEDGEMDKQISSELLPVVTTADVPESVAPPDGGWGWVVCASCFFANGIVFGMVYSFGILYVVMREQFGKDDPHISFKTAWIGSVFSGTMYLLCPVATITSDRIGVRKAGLIGAVLSLAGIVGSVFVENLVLMYLTFGLLMGTGNAFILSHTFVVLGQYFKRHLGLVSGINVAGGSIFTIVMSLLVPKLLETIGLRSTLMVLSAIIATLIPCTLTWKDIALRFGPRQPTKRAHDEEITSTSDIPLSNTTTETKTRSSRFLSLQRCELINKDVLTDKNFIFFMFSYAVCKMGFFVPVVHLVKYATDRFPDSNASMLVLYSAGGSMVSRVVAGKLADRYQRHRVRIQIASFVSNGMCTVGMPLCASFEALIGVTFAWGLVNGFFISFLSPIVYDLVGKHNAPQALGFVFGLVALPTIAVPPLAGLLYDTLGSYDVAFYLAGSIPMVGVFMMLFVRVPAHNAVSGASI